MAGHHFVLQHWPFKLHSDDDGKDGDTYGSTQFKNSGTSAADGLRRSCFYAAAAFTKALTLNSPLKY